MKAAVYKGIKKVEVKEIKKPDAKNLKNEEALIRVKYAGICGTDIHIFKGLHPRASAPIVMGHEISGIIEGIKTSLKDLKVGDKVVVNPLISCGECFACKEGDYHICPKLNLIGIDKNGGFAEYVVANTDKLFKIPCSLSLELAALMEPVAVAVHAVRKSGLSLGNKVAIIGGGPIGQLIAQVCKLSGATSIVLIEVNPERIEFAKNHGITVCSSLEDSIKKINQITNDKGADIVYEAVGIQDTYEYTTKLVKAGGKIIAVGAASKPISMDFWKIYFEELKIIGIHVYEPIDIEITLELLNEYPHIFQPFISKVICLEDLQEELLELSAGKSSAMKILVKVDKCD